MNNTLETFTQKARNAGAMVIPYQNLDDAASYICEKSKGVTLVPQTALCKRHELKRLLFGFGVDVFEGDFRKAGQEPSAGVTFCNFAMADTGTIVLDSTPEDIRLATTLPQSHFVLLDPATILTDNLAAIEPMTTLHHGDDPRFIAYITGPSRTADIERVLTIGCHGPRELHILIVKNISHDIMEC